MSFNITNDPNYYEKQKRLELQQQQLEQQRQKQLQQIIERDTNIDLDIIQYALDHKLYESHTFYKREHWWQPPKRMISIRIHVGYIEGNADLVPSHCRKINNYPFHLSHLVDVISAKNPKWEVYGADYTDHKYISTISDYHYQKVYGRYFITIECALEDFG